jgi:ribosome-associated toxin RatA of RatAB toxin-antitoxin module
MPAGAASAIVEAPPEVVRELVVDYGKYSGYIKRFEQSKVVGKAKDKTDVYLQLPILKGAAKIWAVVRFEPPKTQGDWELISARMLKGNVKRLDANWKLRKHGDSSTELQLELLLVPDFPAPQSVVIPEVRDAAGTAVSGLRAAAEKRTRK